MTCRCTEIDSRARHDRSVRVCLPVGAVLQTDTVSPTQNTAASTDNAQGEGKRRSCGRVCRIAGCLAVTFILLPKSDTAIGVSAIFCSVCFDSFAFSVAFLSFGSRLVFYRGFGKSFVTATAIIEYGNDRSLGTGRLTTNQFQMITVPLFLNLFHVFLRFRGRQPPPSRASDHSGRSNPIWGRFKLSHRNWGLFTSPPWIR